MLIFLSNTKFSFMEEIHFVEVRFLSVFIFSIYVQPHFEFFDAFCSVFFFKKRKNIFSINKTSICKLE